MAHPLGDSKISSSAFSVHDQLSGQQRLMALDLLSSPIQVSKKHLVNANPMPCLVKIRRVDFHIQKDKSRGISVTSAKKTSKNNEENSPSVVAHSMVKSNSASKSLIASFISSTEDPHRRKYKIRPICMNPNMTSSLKGKAASKCIRLCAASNYSVNKEQQLKRNLSEITLRPLRARQIV